MNLSYPTNSQSFNIQCTIKESIDPRKVGILTLSKAKLLRSDEGLTLETSAFESVYGGQFTLSTQLIKPNYLVILPPTQHRTFFRNLPPLISFYLKWSLACIFYQHLHFSMLLVLSPQLCNQHRDSISPKKE